MNFAALSLLLTVFFSTSMSSCGKGNKAEEKPLTEQNMKNISYGSDSANKLDIYLPANRNTTDTKVIMFIHGGSWSGGDKMDFNEGINAIKSKLPDYAIFNLNYRLANYGRNKFPTQLEDIQSALQFIKKNSDEYQVNAEKVVLIGASAGAHLALLQAYRFNEDNNIKAVVDLFGPADLTDLYHRHPVPAASQPVLVNLLGATPATNRTLYLESSPVNYITSQSVPTKIFHGAGDYVVPINQSNALKAKLQANNVKVDMTVYPTEGHGWYGSNLADTYAKTVKFIKENVQ